MSNGTGSSTCPDLRFEDRLGLELEVDNDFGRLGFVAVENDELRGCNSKEASRKIDSASLCLSDLVYTSG